MRGWGRYDDITRAAHAVYGKTGSTSAGATPKTRRKRLYFNAKSTYQQKIRCTLFENTRTMEALLNVFIL